MATININLSEAEIENAKMPVISDRVSNVKSSMGILRWRISEEVSGQRNIRERMEKICTELEEARDMIDDLYQVIQGSIYKYKETDRVIFTNADQFD